MSPHASPARPSRCGRTRGSAGRGAARTSGSPSCRSRETRTIESGASGGSTRSSSTARRSVRGPDNNLARNRSPPSMLARVSLPAFAAASASRRQVRASSKRAVAHGSISWSTQAHPGPPGPPGPRLHAVPGVASAVSITTIHVHVLVTTPSCSVDVTMSQNQTAEAESQERHTAVRLTGTRSKRTLPTEPGRRRSPCRCRSHRTSDRRRDRSPRGRY